MVDREDASRVVRSDVLLPGMDQRAVLVRTRDYDEDDPPPEPLCGPDDVARLLSGMRSRPSEQAVAVLVDDGMVPLAVVPLGEGLKNQTTSSMSALGQAILITKASGVIHVHNHPQHPARSGLPWRAGVDMPSPQDRQMWAMLTEALPMIGVALVDAIVIGGDGGVASGREEQEMARIDLMTRGAEAMFEMSTGTIRRGAGR